MTPPATPKGGKGCPFPDCGWTQNQKLIEWRFDQLDERMDRLIAQYQKLEDISVQTQIGLARLNVKSGFWGALGGVMTAGPALLYFLIKM